MLSQYPQRQSLHNEVHARPPEAMATPLAISHIVMLTDASQREASRAHLSALLRDRHLPMPDATSTHVRMDLGALRVRWEMHTEFVTWTFSRPVDAEAFKGNASLTAAQVVPQDWLEALPGQCLTSAHVWVMPISTTDSEALVRQLLQEDTLVASTVADGCGEVLHRLRHSCRRLFAHAAAGRRLGAAPIGPAGAATA